MAGGQRIRVRIGAPDGQIAREPPHPNPAAALAGSGRPNFRPLLWRESKTQNAVPKLTFTDPEITVCHPQ